VSERFSWREPAFRHILAGAAHPKYINGHSDVLGGAVVGGKDLVGRIHDKTAFAT
jgi:cystathionine beta-lyase/cystathionine gamma-synthase